MGTRGGEGILHLLVLGTFDNPDSALQSRHMGKCCCKYSEMGNYLVLPLEL